MIQVVLLCVAAMVHGALTCDAASAGQGYVEFDFSSRPGAGEGVYELHFTILTADKGIKLEAPAGFSRKEKPESICATMHLFLTENRWKAEVVDKTKLRVYGRMFNDKLIPVTKGTVESKELQPDEVPKVKFVGKKG